jgi:type IV secretory pathway VirB4 component
MRPKWTPRPHEWLSSHLGLFAAPTSGSSVPCGIVLGRDLLGGEFSFDPFTAYSAGRVTNPNMVVFGQLGRGKSTLVKTLLLRAVAAGSQAVVLDPKGEYGPFAEALKATRIALKPGGAITLNPLVGGPSAEAVRRDVALLSTLLEHGLGRMLQPAERFALLAARQQLSDLDEPTLNDMVTALFQPTDAAARLVHTIVAELAADGRVLALELLRLIDGEFAGMFNGATTKGITTTGPVVVLDLSSVWGSDALPLVVACALSWLNARSDYLRPRYLVLDEAWAVLRDPFVARWLQGSWKLARSTATANVLVLHRISDVDSVASHGEQSVALAAGLIADSGTSVCFQLDPTDAADAAATLGLSETATQLVGRLGRGVALWKVGGRQHLVAHEVRSDELAVIDSDQAMRQ